MVGILDDPPASKGTSKYFWLHVQTADPPLSFSLLWFLGSLRSSSRDSACFRSKFDLFSRFILILICPRGELRQKYSMIFKGIFQKYRENRGLFFTRIILQIFSRKISRVYFSYNFHGRTLIFTGSCRDFFTSCILFSRAETRVFQWKMYFFDGKNTQTF